MCLDRKNYLTGLQIGPILKQLGHAAPPSCSPFFPRTISI
jgi:hypothetical protein